MSGDWFTRFGNPPAGEDKVLPLAAAVRQAVRPGMALHFAFTHNRPSAAMAELLRQFRGTDPGFTLIHPFTAGTAVALLTEGLVRRLITTLICEPYPSPAPSRPAQRYLRSHETTVEHWSLLSYVARLEAAARGLPFLPVRSLLGSTLAEDNRAHVRVREGDGTVEVQALTPDLSFVHALCADRSGNALLAPPLGEGVWGALAAREGVVVTAERIVDTEELRRWSHLTGIPATTVRSVSEVPFGAHPTGLAAAGIDGFDPYGDDVAFYREGRQAGRSDGTWRQWVQRWLLDPPDHDTYLARIGSERLLWLLGKGRASSWRPELLETLRTPAAKTPPTRLEAMIVTASRLIARKVGSRGYRAILSGFGSANLAAWLAHDQLSRAGEPVTLLAELGLVGYAPRPCDPYIFNFRNLGTCTQRTDSAMALGVLTSGGGAACLGSLGAGQVDATGNFNSTRLGDGTQLVGSGGANDVASAAAEVVITLPAHPGRLVKRVPYITGPGARVTAVVTDLGVFEKGPGVEPLSLTRLVGAEETGDRETHVRELKERAGFPFEVASELAVEPPATGDETALLRLFDPGGVFLREPEAQ